MLVMIRTRGERWSAMVRWSSVVRREKRWSMARWRRGPSVVGRGRAIAVMALRRRRKEINRTFVDVFIIFVRVCDLDIFFA